MSQMTMEEVLRNPEAPEAQTAEELMTPDERAALEDARAAQAPEAPAESTDAEQPAAEPTEDAAPAETKPSEPEADDLSDLPESIRNTLKQRPEDADNWRKLRESSKASRGAAIEAAREAKAAKARAAALEAEIAQLRQQQAQTAQVTAQTQAAQAAAHLPDPEVDPAGYVRAAMAAEREQIRAEMRSNQLDVYESQAKARHGAEAVEEAFKWASQAAQTDPAFAAQFNAAHDPWDFIVVEKARRDTLTEMGDDPVAYRERIRAEERAAVLAELEQGEATATAQRVEQEIAQRLPRSLAKAPGAGGQAVSDGYAGPTPMSQIVGPGSG